MTEIFTHTISFEDMRAQAGEAILVEPAITDQSILNGLMGFLLDTNVNDAYEWYQYAHHTMIAIEGEGPLSPSKLKFTAIAVSVFLEKNGICAEVVERRHVEPMRPRHFAS